LLIIQFLNRKQLTIKEVREMDTVVKYAECTIDRERLFKRLHLKPALGKKVDPLIAQALEIGKPKIAYRLVNVEEKGDNYVVIDGLKFTSKVLRINFDDCEKVIAFVVTSGTELEEWSKSFTDSFSLLVIDGIKEEILHSATDIFDQEIGPELGLGKTAIMRPGSLPEWPLSEQKPLFQLLGDVKGLIGVELSESFLMDPIKSESGFYFPDDTNYFNCLLCLREECPSRKVPFDRDLYENKYQLSE
jgi:hypothetical protein